jgi:DNA polymerase-1
MSRLDAYAELWAFDFEFRGGEAGEHYDVVCLVARELRTGHTLRLWRDELGARPPYRTDDKALLICFLANAECGCHLNLNWPLPVRLLDLSPEFRNSVNGRAVPHGHGLIGALERYGLATVGQKLKDAWRETILQGPPWSEAERTGILDYCQSDVDGLGALLGHLLPAIDVPRALLRGEFVKASALMEYRGIPIDMGIFSQLRDPVVWDRVREDLIPEVDRAYGVYEGRVFRADLFEGFLNRHNIPWPRLPDTGRLDLKETTFRAQAKTHTQVAPLHELRHTLSKLRRIKLQVGSDARNRTVLWPFKSKTGRTQPKATQYVFGPSVWLRSLIKPTPGQAVAYVDYSAMEFGIAAALSGDQRMLDAYASDPYLDFAISFGAAPLGATKKSHCEVRERFKIMLLAAQYCMGPVSLAALLGISTIEASEMLKHHKMLFARYWQWSDQWLHRALSSGQMRTVFGWTYYLDRQDDEPSIRNWPIQSHGAEILRIGCILAMRRGIALLAPIHDAVLIEAPLGQIDAAVARTKEILKRASRIVLYPYTAGELDGFGLRSDAMIVRYPNRYSDKRGERMWTIVTNRLAAIHAQDENRHADSC